MRKLLLTFFSAATVLLLSGCQDEYLKKIDELNSRVDLLALTCEKLNANLATAESVLTALQERYMLGSVTQNGDGYTMTFIKNDGKSTFERTVYNGEDGKAPIVSMQYENGVGYWAVKYDGDKNYSWLYDANMDRIPVMGNVPYIRINKNTGMWEVSFDKKNYYEIGKANGEQGDSIFSKVDYQNDYVIFTFTDGTSVKIPTFYAYKSVLDDIGIVAENASSMKLLISAMNSAFVYVTKAEPVVSEGDTVGMYVALSNGKNFTIHDFTGTNIPNIYSRLDSTDNNHYWALQYGDEDWEWLVDFDGHRILSEDNDIEMPSIDIAMSDEDGQYYWTVTYGNDTTWLGLNEGVHAMDSVQNTIFRDVEVTEDYLKVTMLDSTVFELPMLFSVSLSATDTLHLFVNDSLTMYSFAADTVVRDTAYISFTAYGSSRTDVTLIPQGGFTAKCVSDSQIMVTAPGCFDEDQGKILAMFSLDGDGSTKTVCKTIYIKRELREVEDPEVEPEEEPEVEPEVEPEEE